jgi:hypothetical protein
MFGDILLADFVQVGEPGALEHPQWAVAIQCQRSSDRRRGFALIAGNLTVSMPAR